MQQYVVVGGGISGLAAAWELIQHVPGRSVTILEGSDRIGGKLRSASVGGLTVDVGAESLLARRREAVDLARQVGLEAEIVHPRVGSAAIWSRGQLHPVPAGTVMGVPSDVETLTGLLTDEELGRARQVYTQEAQPDSDVAIGELVSDQLGEAVVDRLVEPLLGGVYAGIAREISTAAALPAMLPAWQDGRSVTEVAAEGVANRPVAAGEAAPVFAGIRGGVHRLASATAQALREQGVTIRTSTLVREVTYSAEEGGWHLVTGPVPEPTTYVAGGVVLATPASATARLLQAHAPEAAETLARVQSASMALVTLAFDAASMPELPGTGFLVPAVEGQNIKAATFSSNKWAWLDDDRVVILRASLGRHREEATVQRGDDELAAMARADISAALGVALPEPLDQHMQRWGGALPQYAVGHQAAMEQVQEQVASLSGLRLAGAVYDGVGVPACIASGRAAARAVVGGAQ